MGITKKKGLLFGIALILALAVSVSSLFMGQATQALAYSDDTQSESKIYCTATISEDFVDDTVVAVLNQEATFSFKEYAPVDFNEIDCVAVEDLTELTTEVVKQQLVAEKTKNFSALKERMDSNMMVEVDSFRRILSIELREKGKENVLAAIKQLEQRSDIISAEPDFYEKISRAPDDTDYVANRQWGLNGNFGIQAENAWNITTGVATVRVGVIDSGIDGNHLDLTNVINADLHRDYVDTPFLSNVRVVNRADLEDENGHGTHVAGIIGAEGNNNRGISGVAWNIRLVSLRVFDANGSTSASRVRRAVDFATSNNIPILNYSGGGYNNNNARRRAIENYPGLFVCAAGNEDNNNDTRRHYPSDHRLSNLISVGAIMNNGQRPDVNNWGRDRDGNPQGSNFGATTVDIFAPGDNIRSTVVGGGYQNWNGTSMATPFVAGTAALMLSANPNLSASTIKNVIMSNAVTDDVGTPLNGLCVSNSRLNAFGALCAVVFQTAPATGGMSITGIIPNFTFAASTELVLPARFDPGQIGITTVTQIGTGSSVFGGHNITNITFQAGSGVTTIGNSAFSGCTQLSQISIPASVTRIGYGALEGCNNLNSITVPFVGETLNGQINWHLGYIFGDLGFNNMVPASLKNITITSASFLGGGVLSNLPGLENVVLSNSITSIMEQVFFNCPNLKSVKFETNSQLQTISTSAFSGCTALSQISIPANVTTIGANAFQNCNNLTIYTAAPSKPAGWDANWNSSNCPVIWGVSFCSSCGTFTTKSSISTTSHTCANCGAIAAHNWSSINATQHKCSECGATDAHSFYYSNMTALQHTKSCDCGYSVASKHMLTYKSNRQNHIGTCSVCGYSKTEPHIFDITYEMTSLGMVTRYTCATCKYSYDEPRLLTIGRKLVS